MKCHHCNNTNLPRSALCRACHNAVKASGKAWCNAGKHIVPKVRKNGHCPECANRLYREAYGRGERQKKPRVVEAGLCATCGGQLTGHPRCAGCTRLLHSERALCHLCARDRARGVPPEGFPMERESNLVTTIGQNLK